MNLKFLKFGIAGIGILLIICVYGFFVPNKSNESIIRNWVSEADFKSKVVFLSDGTLKEYYDNILQNEFVYSISNSSTQCGQRVYVDGNTSYLTTINNSDSNDIDCYEINGISSAKLSLRPIDKGGF